MHLVVVAPQTESEIRFDLAQVGDGNTALGVAPQCDFQLPRLAVTMGRTHALFRKGEDGIAMQWAGCGATLGHNGRQLDMGENVSISVGDRIQVGDEVVLAVVD